MSFMIQPLSHHSLLMEPYRRITSVSSLLHGSDDSSKTNVHHLHAKLELKRMKWHAIKTESRALYTRPVKAQAILPSNVLSKFGCWVICSECFTWSAVHDANPTRLRCSLDSRGQLFTALLRNFTYVVFPVHVRCALTDIRCHPCRIGGVLGSACRWRILSILTRTTRRVRVCRSVWDTLSTASAKLGSAPLSAQYVSFSIHSTLLDFLFSIGIFQSYLSTCYLNSNHWW